MVAVTRCCLEPLLLNYLSAFLLRSGDDSSLATVRKPVSTLSVYIPSISRNYSERNSIIAIDLDKNFEQAGCARFFR